VEEELADWLAEQYGRISQLRAQGASALTAGEYSTAINLAARTTELSREMLNRLSGAPDSEAFPYLILAFAARADMAAARAADGDQQGASLALWDRDPLWADAASRMRAVLDRSGDLNVSTAVLSQRICPHGRASYTGGCLARPPCPPR
jgi:hypothetical protein